MDSLLVATATPQSGSELRGNDLESPQESVPFLQRHSRRYGVFSRLSNRFKKHNKSNEAIEDVLRDIENSEQLNSRMFIGSLLAILLHVAIGIIVMRYLEGWSIYDAAYFCVVTTTTVGYGDITPSRSISKVFVTYYVIMSIVIISTMLAFVIGTLIDRQEELLLKAIVGDDDADEGEQQSGTGGESLLDSSDVHELLASLFWLAVILAFGVLIFAWIEKLSLLNAIYVTIISASTVGFGDLQPTHNSSKLIMTVWLCFATISTAKVVGEVAGFFANLKQKSATRRLLNATVDIKTLMLLDQDNDRRVDKAEFLAQMLIRSGKVDKDDVQPLLHRFNELDKDNSGYISKEDINL